MKFEIAILVSLLSYLSSSGQGAETDVVRVFDENLVLTEKEIAKYLQDANLEKYGFTRSEEKSTETDKNGKNTTKKTIYYLVTDECSRVMFWESVLQQRLPKKFTETNIFAKTVKEVESRIKGRKTMKCKVGLELHITSDQCFTQKTAEEPGKAKRRFRRDCCNWWNCCRGCSHASIIYSD